MAGTSKSSKLRTTDSIIQDLGENLLTRLEAGETVDVSAVQQEVIAHQELARLRAKRAERKAAGDFLAVNDLNAQVQHWLRFVSVDVDEAAADDPGKNSATLVDVIPVGGTAPADDAAPAAG